MTSQQKPLNINLLGIPLDLGAENLGTDFAPNALRRLKIIEKLEGVGLKILDKGDIEVNQKNKLKNGNSKIKYADEIIRVCNLAAKKIDLILTKKEKVLAIGGDHSISLGTISGASSSSKGNLGVIYLDTHGDINTDKTTPSGNIHGMHVASVLGIGHQQLINVYKKGAKIKKQNIILAGGNDFDKAEISLIKKENIKCFTLMDLLCNGLSPLIKMINDLNKRVKNIWVSLDLDVIDQVYAPAVGIPNTGGLTYREIGAICKYIGQNCNVIGMDAVEYNPLKDKDGKTAELLIELIAKIFGSDYSFYTKYIDKNRI
jgi:arginase